MDRIDREKWNLINSFFICLGEIIPQTGGGNIDIFLLFKNLKSFGP